MNELNILGRKSKLFEVDIVKNMDEIDSKVKNSNFLVVGGAGTVGQSFVKVLASRNPKSIDIIDVNENNLAELVRDLRSSFELNKTRIRLFVIDCLSEEFNNFLDNNKKYDYLLNFAALKHVRSEKDLYTLKRMIKVNVFNTYNLLKFSNSINSKNFFSVSTDKAKNPTNLMGATKNVMEILLFNNPGQKVSISSARFANVAFSDGSLLYSFEQRLKKRQPIVAPNDIKRYFMTRKEAGELCLLSTLFGDKEIFFPKIEKIKPISFDKIARNILMSYGYEPHICFNEKEARMKAEDLIKQKKWPCLFSKSDTSGEKKLEEFYDNNDSVILDHYSDIGIIRPNHTSNINLDNLINELTSCLDKKLINKKKIIDFFSNILSDFNHIEKGKNLDQKM